MSSKNKKTRYIGLDGLNDYFGYDKKKKKSKKKGPKNKSSKRERLANKITKSGQEKEKLPNFLISPFESLNTEITTIKSEASSQVRKGNLNSNYEVEMFKNAAENYKADLVSKRAYETQSLNADLNEFKQYIKKEEEKFFYGNVGKDDEQPQQLSGDYFNALEERKPVTMNFYLDTEPVKKGSGRRRRDRRSDHREPRNSYIPLGMGKVFKSEESNLSRKLNQFFNSDNEEVDLDEEKKLEEEEMEIDPELEQMLKNPVDRYYNRGGSSTKCRRCGQLGHIAKHCTNKKVLNCWFCLGDHRKDECPQDTCFRCGEMGHRGNDCPKQKHNFCRRCRKRGHRVQDCTFLINFRHVDDRTWEHKNVDPSVIKCISCFNPGHLQCHIKGNKMKKLFKKDKIYLDSNLRAFRAEFGVEDGESILKQVRKLQVKKLSDLAFVSAMELDALDGFNNYDESEKTAKKKKYLKKRYPAKRPEGHKGDRKGDRKGKSKYKGGKFKQGKKKKKKKKTKLFN